MTDLQEVYEQLTSGSDFVEEGMMPEEASLLVEVQQVYEEYPLPNECSYSSQSESTELHEKVDAWIEKQEDFQRVKKTFSSLQEEISKNFPGANRPSRRPNVNASGNIPEVKFPVLRKQEKDVLVDEIFGMSGMVCKKRVSLPRELWNRISEVSGASSDEAIDCLEDSTVNYLWELLVLLVANL